MKRFLNTILTNLRKAKEYQNLGKLDRLYLISIPSDYTLYFLISLIQNEIGFFGESILTADTMERYQYLKNETVYSPIGTEYWLEFIKADIFSEAKDIATSVSKMSDNEICIYYTFDYKTYRNATSDKTLFQNIFYLNRLSNYSDMLTLYSYFYNLHTKGKVMNKSLLDVTEAEQEKGIQGTSQIDVKADEVLKKVLEPISLAEYKAKKEGVTEGSIENFVSNTSMSNEREEDTERVDVEEKESTEEIKLPNQSNDEKAINKTISAIEIPVKTLNFLYKNYSEKPDKIISFFESVFKGMVFKKDEDIITYLGLGNLRPVQFFLTLLDYLNRPLNTDRKQKNAYKKIYRQMFLLKQQYSMHSLYNKLLNYMTALLYLKGKYLEGVTIHDYYLSEEYKAMQKTNSLFKEASDINSVAVLISIKELKNYVTDLCETYDYKELIQVYSIIEKSRSYFFAENLSFAVCKLLSM